MATFYTKQYLCDFEDLTSNKISRNKMLEVTAEDVQSTRKYMQISFGSDYFQDSPSAVDYIFGPNEIGTRTYNTDYYCEQTTYNPSQMYRWSMVDPKFIAFDSEDTSYTSNFTGSAWGVSGWINPETDYEGWVNNIKDTYTTGGVPPESVNLYIFKIINLKMDAGFSTSARYVPIMFAGNDPNL